jgi:hypothetical protein
VTRGSQRLTLVRRVASHRPRLDDLTDARGAIAEVTIADVEGADAGFACGQERSVSGCGVRIPRLKDVVARCRRSREHRSQERRRRAGAGGSARSVGSRVET